MSLLGSFGRARVHLPCGLYDGFLPSQGVPGEPPSADLRADEREPVGIVHVFPEVVAESLLVQVSKQVERLDTDVGSPNTTLQLHLIRFKHGTSWSESQFDPTARAVAPMQALASLIRSVHLPEAGLARRVSQRTNSAIRMTMGIGTPSIRSKIERMVSKPPQSI